jgi:hypothetical protein
MKTIDYISDDVPTYALPYLVNGDSSGMEESDIAACDAWFDECTAKLQSDYPGASIQFLTADGDEYGEHGDEFNRNPAFGLACATLKCVFAVWVDNEDPRPALPLPWEPEPIEPDEDGAIEKAIRECLEIYPEGTLFDCIAHELWPDGEGGYSVNDSWCIARGADLDAAIESIAGRWDVWQLNYCPDARASDLEDIGGDTGSLLEALGVPFMEIRPA